MGWGKREELAGLDFASLVPPGKPFGGELLRGKLQSTCTGFLNKKAEKGVSKWWRKIRLEESKRGQRGGESREEKEKGSG